MKIVAAVLGMVLFPFNALGAGMGPDLYQDCVGVQRNSQEDAVCNLYIAGISAGITIAQDWYHAGGKFCLPEGGLDYRQVRAIVEKFMKDHPEKLNAKASLVVAGALLQAFPCKSSN